MKRKNARAFFSGSRVADPCRDPASKRWSCGARNLVHDSVMRRKNAHAFFSGSRVVDPCRDPASKRWSCGARNPRPERFRPLSDENFSVGKVRELRAYSLRRKNARAFFRLFNSNEPRELRLYPRCCTLCRRLSKLRFSSFSGWNRRRWGISPSATSLRSWIAAGLRVLHESKLLSQFF